MSRQQEQRQRLTRDLAVATEKLNAYTAPDSEWLRAKSDALFMSGEVDKYKAHVRQLQVGLILIKCRLY